MLHVRFAKPTAQKMPCFPALQLVRVFGRQADMHDKQERFAQEKADLLARRDKSSKGDWDAPIVPLLNEINSYDQYCTLSSCSGRAFLWRPSREKDPKEPQQRLLPAKGSFSRTWRFHICHSFDEWSPDNAVAGLPTEHVARYSFGSERGLHVDAIWARFEPFILHVACRSLEDAFELIDISRRAFPKSSLLSFRKRFVVQVPGEDYVDLPYCFRDPDSFNASDWAGFSGYLNYVIQDKFQMNSHRIGLFKEDLRSQNVPAALVMKVSWVWHFGFTWA